MFDEKKRDKIPNATVSLTHRVMSVVQMLTSIAQGMKLVAQLKTYT
jgi:hypothetical protein